MTSEEREFHVSMRGVVVMLRVRAFLRWCERMREMHSKGEG